MYGKVLMLKTDSSMLLLALDSIKDAVIWVSLDNRIVLSNQAASKLFGYDVHELLDMPFYNLFPIRLQSGIVDFIRQAAASPGRKTEINGRLKNGQELDLAFFSSNIQYRDQSTVSLQIREIEYPQFAREVLQESEARYRGLVESQTNLIVRVDNNGLFTFVNQAYCNKFGKSPKELLGKNFTPLVHPDDLPQTLAAMEQLKEPPYRILVEQRALTADGWRWIAWEDSIIHNESGQPIEIQAIGRDITESKQNKALLISQRDLAQGLAATFSMEEALNLCLDRAISESGMDSGGVYLVDRLFGDLELVVSAGLSEQFVAGVSTYPVNSDRWQFVMAGKPIYTRYRDLPVSSLNIDEGLQSMGIIPILHQGHVVACFNLASHTQEEISEIGQEAINEIALQVGSAIVRIQTETDLVESEHGLQMLFDTMQDFIFVLSLQGDILRVNRQVIGRLGYSEIDLVGKSVLHVHPPEDRENALAIVMQMVEGKLDTFRLQLIAKDGERIPVETKVSMGSWKSQPALIGVSRDISERLVIEQQLHYRSQFEDLLTQISTRFINLSSENEGFDAEINVALSEIGSFEKADRSYVFLFDSEMTTMNNSHEWCAPGVEPQIDSLQDLPTDIFPYWMSRLQNFEPIHVRQLSDFPEEAVVEKEILAGQDIRSIAVIPLVFNKKLLGFIGYDYVMIERSWSEDSIAMLTMFGNILSSALERKWTESALRESKERNAALLNAIPDMMFRIRSDGTFLDYASPDENNLLLPATEIIGSHINAAIGSELGSQALECIHLAISSGEKQTLEYEVPLSDGPVHFESRFVASAPDEVIAIIRDVSERIRLEQMKSDFINRATHDLRTPLTTIMLMVRLLEGDCTPEEHQEYWEVLKEEIERERALIEDLLMVGRLEEGLWQVALHPLDMQEILELSIQSITPQAIENDITIEYIHPADLPHVMGDTAALQQVFANLLSNAIKYSNDGGQIKVMTFKKDSRVWVQIQDNGMGIPANDLPNIFMRFFRAQNANLNEVPGSGMGLYIVKSIIENLQGDIKIFSELGVGTTIEFWLPPLEPVIDSTPRS
jgi:PAS domain S-box-containing protein